MEEGGNVICALGKFDQFEDRPYGGFSQALTHGLARLRGTPMFAKLGTVLREAVVLQEICPTLLELCLESSKYAVPPVVEPSENAVDRERRIVLALSALFDLFGSCNYQFQLVFEDLHWADPKSLSIITSLPRFVLLATFRQDERQPSVPLALFRTKILESAEWIVHVVKMKPLRSGDVGQMLKDAMGYREKTAVKAKMVIEYQQVVHRRCCFFFFLIWDSEIAIWTIWVSGSSFEGSARRCFGEDAQVHAQQIRALFHRLERKKLSPQKAFLFF